MSEMEDRVANAIGPFIAKASDRSIAARAAIEAMREPTPEMLKAAGKWWEATLHNAKTGWENGEIIYLSMIDAALSEGQPQKEE